MVDSSDADEAAAQDTLDVIGHDVISMLAAAANKHNVTISVYIAPREEMVGESPDDDE